MKKSVYIFMVFVLVLGLPLAWQQSSVQAQDSDSVDLVALGEALFFDQAIRNAWLLAWLLSTRGT